MAGNGSYDFDLSQLAPKKKKVPQGISMQTKAVIENMDLFKGLSEDGVDKLDRVAVPMKVGKGQAIFEEGQPAKGFYAIGSGRVKIYKSSPAGREQILHLMGAGEVFAEVALFAGREYPASAMAMEDSELLFFPKDAFSAMLAGDPELAVNMLALLSLRLRAFTVQVENLSLREVPGRLSAHLLLLAGETKDEVRLDLPKGQLAALLGTIPETLSRVLRKMDEEELIQADGPAIRLLDKESLRQLASGEMRL